MDIWNPLTLNHNSKTVAQRSITVLVAAIDTFFSSRLPVLVTRDVWVRFREGTYVAYVVPRYTAGSVTSRRGLGYYYRRFLFLGFLF
jgi:hypothetical protein